MIDFKQYLPKPDDKLVLVDTETREFIKDSPKTNFGVTYHSMDDGWIDAITFDLMAFRSIDHLKFVLVFLSTLRNPTVDSSEPINWQDRFNNNSIRRKLRSSLEVWVTNGCDIRTKLEPDSIIDEIWTDSWVSSESHPVIYKIFNDLEQQTPNLYQNYMVVRFEPVVHESIKSIARVLSEYRNSGEMIVKDLHGTFFVASKTESLLVEARLKLDDAVKVMTFTRESLIALRDRRFDLI